MEKVLVTGVETMLGYNLARGLSERFSVLASGLQVDLDGCEAVRAPDDTVDGLAELVAEHQPDWVVHVGPTALSAWDAPTGDFNLPEHYLESLTRMQVAVQACGAKLTVLSSDAAFCGPRLFHEENAVPSAPTDFARAVVAVEQQLMRTPTLIVRTHAYGWGPSDDTLCFAEQLWQDLHSGVPCPVDAERHATPILATDLADLLERALRAGLQGLLHLGGSERTSPFRFAATLAVTFGLSGRLVQFCGQDIPSGLRQPTEETSLNTWRARRVLRVAPPMLREGLNRFAAQHGILQHPQRQTAERMVPMATAHAA